MEQKRHVHSQHLQKHFSSHSRLDLQMSKGSLFNFSATLNDLDAPKVFFSWDSDDMLTCSYGILLVIILPVHMVLSDVFLLVDFVSKSYHAWEKNMFSKRSLLGLKNNWALRVKRDMGMSQRFRLCLCSYIVSWRILSFGAKQLLIFVCCIYVFINCWCCALVARGVVSCLSVVIFHNKASSGAVSN